MPCLRLLNSQSSLVANVVNRSVMQDDMIDQSTVTTPVKIPIIPLSPPPFFAGAELKRLSPSSIMESVLKIMEKTKRTRVEF